MVTRVQILDKVVDISHGANTFREGMNSIILLPTKDELYRRQGSFGWQGVWEKEKPGFKTVKLLLKNIPISCP